MLHIKAGQRLSLQRHKRRSELWLVLDGDAGAQIGYVSAPLSKGSLAIIPRMERHRLYSMNGGTVLEVSEGKFSEGDIERLEDDYGRARL